MLYQGPTLAAPPAHRLPPLPTLPQQALVTFTSEKYPRLCGRTWRLWGTVANDAGTSRAADGGTHTTADCDP